MRVPLLARPICRGSSGRRPAGQSHDGELTGVRSHGRLMARKTSFYYSFLVLPADQRRAVIAVWDFCRAVDDAVDERPEGDATGPGREAICFWRAELARCFDGGEPQSRQGQCLQPFIARY